MKFKKGDKIRLSKKGMEFYETGKFPLIIRVIYGNIINGKAEVIGIDGDHVRIKFTSNIYPVNERKGNNFGVYLENVELCDTGNE